MFYITFVPRNYDIRSTRLRELSSLGIRWPNGDFVECDQFAHPGYLAVDTDFKDLNCLELRPIDYLEGGIPEGYVKLPMAIFTDRIRVLIGIQKRKNRESVTKESE